MHERRVAVIGAGLAVAEAADRLARYGIRVDLYEMKPVTVRPHIRGTALRSWSARILCAPTGSKMPWVC